MNHQKCHPKPKNFSLRYLPPTLNHQARKKKKRKKKNRACCCVALIASISSFHAAQVCSSALPLCLVLIWSDPCAVCRHSFKYVNFDPCFDRHDRHRHCQDGSSRYAEEPGYCTKATMQTIKNPRLNKIRRPRRSCKEHKTISFNG